MALIKLTVVYQNGKALKTPRVQLFDCNDIADKAIDVGAGRSSFIIQKPKVPIPQKYVVQYTVTEIQDHCNHCCTS